MRRLSLFVTLMAAPLLADEKTKPNALSAKEIAVGWIQLFDGESTFGWTVVGDAKVKAGVMILGGEKAASMIHATQFGSFECVGEISSDNKQWENRKFILSENGEVRNFSNPISGKPKFSLDVNKNRVELSTSVGRITYIRSVRIKLEKVDSLFNGKDLTGWKVFEATKDKKVASKFAVTKEGWLNVKDGPGDLQTEGQWADFVAQFECISNGKHLNSGLFFRCLPGQYQQGYEAQIRNEWMEDDRTKPVDFGTGAIYRRQAARKVVSTDGEWFTMTVAAHGKHLATWVNGYQVTDWSDDRKESDNARQGAKRTRGALSIQGHDPTTDLSFRNIRIQSLDKK